MLPLVFVTTIMNLLLPLVLIAKRLVMAPSLVMQFATEVLAVMPPVLARLVMNLLFLLRLDVNLFVVMASLLQEKSVTEVKAVWLTIVCALLVMNLLPRQRLLVCPSAMAHLFRASPVMVVWDVPTACAISDGSLPFPHRLIVNTLAMVWLSILPRLAMVVITALTVSAMLDTNPQLLLPSIAKKSVAMVLLMTVNFATVVLDVLPCVPVMWATV